MVLLVLVATIIVFLKSKVDKSTYKNHDDDRERRESLIREPVCKDIISKVGHLNLSARDNYFTYDLALSNDVIASLHSAVLKHSENFDTILLSKCPNLNNNDLLLCYLLLLGLNEKQIAVLRNRTYSAIKKQIDKIEKQLNDIYGTNQYHYSVWYKNGLHNVYVYCNGQSYEYEYFEEDDKIRLEEINRR